ncbi:MAG: YgiT-type zinc finger protein [Acidobacteriota bacterium]
MYGYGCEACSGTVREKVVKREIFKLRTGFVILEDVPFGICDRCGERYYSAKVLEVVDAVAVGKKPAERIEHVPVARL